MRAPLSWIRDFTPGIDRAPVADLVSALNQLGLEAATELGRDVREVLGLDDVIFDLAITPNRPDAMCIVGVARELAAHFSLDFHVPEPRVTTDPAVARDINIVIEDDARCPRYLG